MVNVGREARGKEYENYNEGMKKEEGGNARMEKYRNGNI